MNFKGNTQLIGKFSLDFMKYGVEFTLKFKKAFIFLKVVRSIFYTYAIEKIRHRFWKKNLALWGLQYLNGTLSHLLNPTSLLKILLS